MKLKQEWIMLLYWSNFLTFLYDKNYPPGQFLHYTVGLSILKFKSKLDMRRIQLASELNHLLTTYIQLQKKLYVNTLPLRVFYYACNTGLPWEWEFLWEWESYLSYGNSHRFSHGNSHRFSHGNSHMVSPNFEVR